MMCLHVVVQKIAVLGAIYLAHDIVGVHALHNIVNINTVARVLDAWHKHILHKANQESSKSFSSDRDGDCCPLSEADVYA